MLSLHTVMQNPESFSPEARPWGLTLGIDPVTPLQMWQFAVPRDGAVPLLSLASVALITCDPQEQTRQIFLLKQ